MPAYRHYYDFLTSYYELLRFIRFKRRVSKSLQSILISILFVLQMARGIN